MGSLVMNGQNIFEQVGTNRPTTGAGFPAGHIVQVKSVNITDKITLSMDDTTFVDVPGLSLTITVSQGNSVLIMSEVTGSGSTVSYDYPSLWWYILDRNGTQIANSYDRIYYVDFAGGLQKQTLTHIDSNLSAGTYVYKIRANQDYGGAVNYMTINETYNDDASHPGHTNMTIMEIVGSAT